MTTKGNKSNWLRCPLCGRQPVKVKRDRLVSHLSPGGVRCAAQGFSAVQAGLFQTARRGQWHSE